LDIHTGYPLGYPDTVDIQDIQIPSKWITIGISVVIRFREPLAYPSISVLDHHMDIYMDIYMDINMVIHSDNHGYTFGYPS
jgi:hypothetical protein